MVLYLAVGSLHATAALAFLSELPDPHLVLRRDLDNVVGEWSQGMMSDFPVGELVAETAAAGAVRVFSWYYRHIALEEHGVVYKCRKRGHFGDIGSCEHGTAHKKSEDAGVGGART